MLTEVQIAIIVAVPSITTFFIWMFGRQKAKGSGREEQLYYELQEAKLSYLFSIEHSRFPFFCKLLYWFCPFKLKWQSKDVLRWGAVSLVARNEFDQDLYGIEDVEIRRAGESVKIIWPRGKLIKPEAKKIVVEISEHVSQDEISKMVKTEVKKKPIKKSICRWEYKLKNDSEAIIRDFELILTDKVNDPKDIKILNVRPALATNEIDIVLKGECSLDMLKSGQGLKVNEIVWKLPKMEKQDETVLIFEC